MDVGRWLASLGLAQYGEFFAANDIDLDALRTLTDADLREFGIASLGHRRKLLQAIAALGVEAPAPLSRTMPREAERRQLTVMFVDLVGSTALSARLDPEEIREVIQAYQNAVAGKIARFEGHVAKFMGDGVLAYFGWPRAHEYEAERAVRAGLSAVEAVGGLHAPDASALAARVGIATGTVVVGDLIGRGPAEEEAAVGETPNLAARLQDLAPLGGVVVAESTRRLLGRLFELDDFGARPLKGFSEPVRCFRVVRESGAEGRFEALHGERVTPLVGREHEIGLLLDRFARAREGDGQVVLLAGEPGIGKSRLVRALRNRLAANSYMPLTHHCSPYHINTPLWPVIVLLERVAGLARDNSAEDKLRKLEALLAPHVRDLGEATALLGPLLGLSTGERCPQADLTPDRHKERTQEVLLDQLQGLAAERPVLCVYEDAHWMDPSTVELVGLVVERVQRLPVLLVVTFRPELTPPWPHHSHVTQLSLSRLTRRHAAAMVDHLTGGKALPPEVLAPIAERTDGVPLFVEELTKVVLESGLLRDAGDRFTLAGSLPPLAIPATLHDSLMARLDRLGPVKEVAQLGAAIGREFTYELLAAVATTTEPVLRDALAQLVAAELVFCRGHPPEATYAFKHALVQDAAYQSLLKSRRAQLHARIVRTIEQRFPTVCETQPELIAHHAAEAGLADKAIEYWLAAGRRAASGWANPEAIAYLRRALDALAGQAETVERARRELEVQTTLAAPLIATRGFSSTEVEIAYSRAEQLARELAHPTHLTTALRGLCAVNHVRAKLRLAERLGLELLGRVESEDNPLKLADAHNAIAFDIFHLGRYRAARHHLKRSQDLISAAGNIAHAIFIGVDIRPFTGVYLAHCDWHLGYPDRALAEAEQAIELARRLSDPFSQAVALDYTAMLHQFRREPRQVHEQAEAALALCSKRGFAYYRAWASVLLGWADVAQGDVGQGLVRLKEGLRNLCATGAELRLPYYLGLLGRAQLLAGHRDEAAASLAEAEAVAERNAESWTLPELHLLEGDLALAGASPDDDGAAACFRRAATKAGEQDAIALVLRASLALARLHLAHGRRTEAHDLVAPLYARFTEGLDTPDLVEAKAILDAG